MCVTTCIFVSSFILHFKQAAELYLKYAKLEEDHGLVRHAMAIYDRATKVLKCVLKREEKISASEEKINLF